MVPSNALDPRLHQCMQRPEIRYQIFLRHLRILRRIYLSSKRNTGASKTRIWRWFLPLHYDCTTRSRCGVYLWSHWIESTVPALHSTFHQRLRHASYCYLLYGLRSHWQDEGRRSEHVADKQCVLSNGRQRMVHSLLGYQDWRCVYCDPLCNPADDFVLL